MQEARAEPTRRPGTLPRSWPVEPHADKLMAREWHDDLGLLYRHGGQPMRVGRCCGCRFPAAKSARRPSRRYWVCHVWSICFPVLASKKIHATQLLGVGAGAGEAPGAGLGTKGGGHSFQLNAHVSSLSAL